MQSVFPMRVLYKVEYDQLGDHHITYFMADTLADVTNAIHTSVAYRLGQVKNIQIHSLRAVNIVP